jgi:hypothetical protein
MSRLDPVLDRAIQRLARRQHGLVSRAQLEELGVTRYVARSRVRSGAWSVAAPGVFLVGPAPGTFAQRAMAAALSAGTAALASHRTAALLHGIIPRRAVPLEVSVPRAAQVRRRGIVVHRSTDLHLAGRVQVDGVPTTGLARTLVDLGAVEPTWVRTAVWEARRLHGVSWEELLAALVDHGRSGRRGVGVLRRIVAEHYGELARDSSTEDLAFAILRGSGRVPLPACQVPVVCADGVEVTIDFGWPEYRAYLEIFGGHHLHDEDLLHLDLHRRNQIELAGNALLIYSGRLLRRQPDQFVADVLALLRRRGWPGNRAVA